MTTQAPEKHELLILSLDKGEQYEGMFEAVHSDLLQHLIRTRKVTHSRTLQEANLYLSDPTTKPVAVLVPYAYIAERKNAALCTRIRDYVKYGGLAIFAGTFSSFIKPTLMTEFWKAWHKDWKFGDYGREDTKYNKDEKSGLSSEYMDLTYSQKAVFLSNVNADDAVYLASNAQRTHDLVQTPVALSRFGDGRVGYVGDVNGERGSIAIVLAMVDLAVEQAVGKQHTG